MEIVLRINGKPFGKQRPRFYAGHAYTPKETREYEQRIKTVWRAKKVPQLEGYINIYIEANYPVPESATRWKKMAMMLGVLFPRGADVDNISKICLDALNGLAWEDDSMVVLLTVRKNYAENAGVTIHISSTEPVEERCRKFRAENGWMKMNGGWAEYDRKRDS